MSQVSLVMEVGIDADARACLCVLCCSVACFRRGDFFKRMVSGTSLLRKTQINTNTNTANDTFLKIIHVYHVIFKNTNMLHKLVLLSPLVNCNLLLNQVAQPRVMLRPYHKLNLLLLL